MGPTKTEISDRPAGPVERPSPDIAPPASRGPDSEQIRHDIARTRGKMDETLSALGDRLHPKHLLDQVFEAFRESSGETTREARETLRASGRKLSRQVRQHPIPALLMMAGATWWFLEGEDQEEHLARRHREHLRWDSGPPPTPEHAGSFVDARTGEVYDESYGEEWWRERDSEERGQMARETAVAARDKAAGAAKSAQAAVGRTADKAASAAGQAGEMLEHAGEAMSSAGRRAADYTRDAGRRAERLGTRAGRQLQAGYDRGKRRMSDALEESPLAIGIACAAAGLLAGMILPGTRREDELMGEQSGALKHAAREAVEQGKETAVAATAAASREAERQGIAPDQLAEKAGRIAAEAKASATEAAREEELTPGQLKEKAQHVAEEARRTAQEEAQRRTEESTL